MSMSRDRFNELRGWVDNGVPLSCGAAAELLDEIERLRKLMLAVAVADFDSWEKLMSEFGPGCIEDTIRDSYKDDKAIRDRGGK